MTKLSDTQLIVLSAAARRPTLLALPLPPRLKGGARAQGDQAPHRQRPA